MINMKIIICGLVRLCVLGEWHKKWVILFTWLYCGRWNLIVLVFCKAHYDYTIDRNWKVDDFVTFRSSFCYSFAECAKILESFPPDARSKTYCDSNNITGNIIFIYIKLINIRIG